MSPDGGFITADSFPENETNFSCIFGFLSQSQLGPDEKSSQSIRVFRFCLLRFILLKLFE